jgi:nucleotide-binding universal stress UspA family protein
MLEHILVPLDGSPLAEQALPYARKILAPTGRLTVVGAVDLPDVLPHSFYPLASASLGNVSVDPAGAGYNPQEMLRLTRAYIDQTLDPLREQTQFVIEVVLEVGEPAELIVQTAKARNVDAIVMSTHGRSGLSRWLFGSVTTKVLNASPCPVFVIPNRYLEQRSDE